MIQFNKGLICLLFFTMVLWILVPTVEATTVNFTVPKGEEITKPISLAVEDRVLIRFTVVGQSEKTLHFRIAYPDGVVKDFGEVGYFDYSFVCDVEGEYVLHFSNKDSIEEKLVTLDYEVQHYIFGMPQMLFLTIVIVLVCVGAVATFTLMGKPH